MTILGIETSCDETALALIETRGNGNDLEIRVIQSLVHSQAELHSAYGGVFPTLAKREHGKNLVPLLEKILSDITPKSKLKDKQITSDQFKGKLESFKTELAGQNPELLESLEGAEFLKNIPNINHISVTEGPGLEPALWVGINFARILGELWNIPVIPINHMEGHIVASLLEFDSPYGTWQKMKVLPLPAIALLISGGHTELVKINGIGKYEIIGQTKDDAVGEAFDKTARLLGLPYPGGPHLSRLAAEAEIEGLIPRIKLPRPMINSKDLDFSFSGLKTAVLYAVKKAEEAKEFTNTYKKELALEFESAVADVLERKLHSAINENNSQSIIIGGGVAANNRLRERLEKVAKYFSIPLFLPSKHLSGDNALMIAVAGALENSPNITNDGVLKAHGTKRLGV